MPKIPTNGYSNPLGPKIEKAPVPVGYIELNAAVDVLGTDMYPGEWTGDERGYFRTGAWGQKFRSKIEHETDDAFRDAVLFAQCELECELYGGDPKKRYKLRKASVDDKEPFMPLGDLPTLSKEEMQKIESHLSDKFKAALAVRSRREKVEDVFLRQLLWSGSLTANVVAVDGKVVALKSHIWGADEGKRIFERGWIELDKGGDSTSTRPVLIKASDLEPHLSSSLKAKPLSSDIGAEPDIDAPPRFSKAAVRSWYQDYIEGFAKESKKPSREEDLIAAREHFSVSIPRDFMRDLRNELAPLEWKAKGAPKRRNSDGNT
jgi:hypothetical protein